MGTYHTLTSDAVLLQPVMVTDQCVCKQQLILKVKKYSIIERENVTFNTHLRWSKIS